MKLYLLHPAAVHFPVALLVAGWAAGLAEAAAGHVPAKNGTASRLLWAGALSAWAALGLGLLAESTAPGVPAAHETLEIHETLAWAATLGATALGFWRWRWPLKARWALLLAWGGVVVLTLAAAREGGELVFEHNLGTAAASP